MAAAGTEVVWRLKLVLFLPQTVELARVNGNSVAPQIPELIGRAIIAYEQLAMAA
jgi:hypothetical protein